MQSEMTITFNNLMSWNHEIKKIKTYIFVRIYTHHLLINCYVTWPDKKRIGYTLAVPAFWTIFWGLKSNQNTCTL